MARKIRLDQIGDKFRKEVSTLVAATTLEATARLKLATPVDTGTLRNSWLPEIKELSTQSQSSTEQTCRLRGMANTEHDKALSLAIQI
jgi:hypothetical protein